MGLLIDTAAVSAGERLDFWLESSSDAYHPLQVRSPAKDRFWARMSGHELGPLSFFKIAAAPNTMIRTSRAIALADPESLHLHVVLSGVLNAAQEGRTCTVEAGDVFSYETSHPTILRADRPFESLVVSVPRRLLGTQAAEIAKLTATRIPGSEWRPRAAASCFRKLLRSLESGELASADAQAAVDCVLALVRNLYVGDAPAPELSRERSRAGILLSVESYIEAKLGDPNLDPEEIARASFISTRYLHKLFESEGTSVCQWIRSARLERCRGDLVDPSLRHQTILSIASRWGLPGPQHFCRVFRSAYGVSPREFRREAKRAAAAA